MSAIKCPKCGEAMELKTTNQRTGAIIGSSLGGIAGFMGRNVSARAGMAIGAGFCSIIPGIGSAVGAATGSVVGALAGFVAGGSLGSKVGKVVDESYRRRYFCPSCDKTINL